MSEFNPKKDSFLLIEDVILLQPGQNNTYNRPISIPVKAGNNYGWIWLHPNNKIIFIPLSNEKLSLDRHTYKEGNVYVKIKGIQKHQVKVGNLINFVEYVKNL